MTDERLREETVSIERLYEGKIVNVRMDTVKLSSGATATREVVEHAHAVAMVPLTEASEVVLVRQFRVPTGRVMLEIPAGVIDPGEDPAEAAQRELAEEIGHRAGRLHHLFSLYLAPGYSTELIHIFLATDLVEENLAPDEDEIIATELLPLAEARRRVLAGELQDAKTAAAILAVAERTGNVLQTT
ncbi:MAG: NUDIX hydrolase [Armatimonadota bacterium]